MNLDQITTKCWILALIIRDDGERLLLGDGWFDFKDSLQHFQPNSIANDIVELQGTDGQLLAGQVRRSASQSFDGYVGDALTSKTEIESRRRQFIQFFRTRRHYKVIYIFPDGTAIQRRMGYLTDAPSVPEMWQKFPEYHVALNFEDVNYYEYAEDAQGDEIYAHDSLVKLISVQSGGLVWDEYGAVSHGYTWLNPQTVTGDYITVTDGATGSPLTLSQLTGNATQDGTPTPDAPQPISIVTGENTVKVEGKNLFYLPETLTNSVNSITITRVQGQSAFTLNGTNSGSATSASVVRVANPLPVKAGTYTLTIRGLNQYDNSTDRIYIAKSTSVGTPIAAMMPSNNWTQTFTLAEDADILFQIIFSASASYSNKTITVQLELGSTATAYEPYQGQEFPIDLGSIELAKIGTYQDRIYKTGGKWYIEKQVGKVVLDGTQTGLYTSGAHPRYAVGVSDIKRVSSASDVGAVISDHFTTASVSAIYSGQDGAIGVHNSSYEVWLSNSVLTSANDWTTWLASNPTTVYYALATPTTTEITDETLLAQLNFIASLYGGVNNISIVPTGGAQGEMTLNYYADVDTTGAGYEWEAGEGGGPTTVQVIGVDNAQPIWTVTGPATNPTLTNITTVQTITWNGTVPNGQKLIVDMANQTATLAGANVYEFITGSWLTLRPGANKLTYSAQGADQASRIEWNGVVG